MKKNILLSSFVCLFILSTLQTQAWGVLGHRIVGQVAESYLSSDARKEVRALLGNESIAIASNWMDFIKSDSTYKYLSNWHYLNIRSGLNQAEFIKSVEADTSTNAYTKILWLSTALKNKVYTMETRGNYLRMLIHLVGDVHQPMHVGRSEDQGGNKIKLTWFNDNVNLHQVWDERLINFSS